MGFNAMLDDATGVLGAVQMGLDGLFIVLGLSVGFGIMASLGGPLGVFMRSFAIYFYGGYYKTLGDRLDASLPAAADGAIEVR